MKPARLFWWATTALALSLARPLSAYQPCLAAFLVLSAETLMSMATRANGPSPGEVMVPGPNHTTTVRAEAIGPISYNCTQSEWVERAASKVGPEPMSVFATPWI
jgi:hypothetical protein